MNPVFANLPVSVFEVMSQLARTHEAINLGQGFPDDPGPEDVRRKAAEAVVSGWNQYPSMLGIPELRQAIAAHYRHWQGLALDPDGEIMVTSGATEALAAGGILALPDFVTNAGGIHLYEAPECREDPARCLDAVERLVAETTRRVLTAADADRVTPTQAALEIARAFLRSAQTTAP